jgi:glycosyltransferase involved in cell wall biosynthesis
MINHEISPSRSSADAAAAPGTAAAERLAHRKFQPMALPQLPERPLFSILIRNYNYGRYIRAALESAVRQTYPNFEVVVCDDGSTDDSRAAIQEYIHRDSRVRLILQENRGAAGAANAAYAVSKGQLIAFLDADDTFQPSKLEKVLAVLKAHPRSGFCVHPMQPIHPDGRLAGPAYPLHVDHGWIGPEKLRQGSLSFLPPMSGLTFRREALAPLFPIPVELLRMEDHYLCTAQFFTEISLAPECLTEYRVHGASLSSAPGDEPQPFWSRFDAEGQKRYIRDLETVLLFQKTFLDRFYGPAAAETLRIEDHQGYWDSLLGIRALCGKQAGAIRPYTVQEMISHVSRPANKRMWRAIMRLPDPLAKRVYCLWRGSSPVKHVVKKLMLPLIRR